MRYCLLIEPAVACRLSHVAGIIRPWKIGESVNKRKQPQYRLSFVDAASGQVKIPSVDCMSHNDELGFYYSRPSRSISSALSLSEPQNDIEVIESILR